MLLRLIQKNQQEKERIKFFPPLLVNRVEVCNIREDA